MSQFQEYEGTIAIIGMAGRFPQAPTLTDYWQRIEEGAECVSQFSEETLVAAGVSASELANPAYVKARAVLDDIELFDAEFFQVAPREATWMDPQQRLFLETAWHALEDAGYVPGKDTQSCGLFAGTELSTYSLYLLQQAEIMDAGKSFQAMLGNDKDFLATFTAYKLNLQGPSLTVQTACSTSLTATHLACQSLLNLECDLCLAGAVSVTVPQHSGYIYQQESVYSPDGHCRPFDAEARGTVNGSGVGAVLLKRTEDALADNDNIYAIILGSALNNDGAQKAGFTAPGVTGQAQVITEAMVISDVSPETISYVETHGTGTTLGDLIEVQALTDAFHTHTTQKGFCALGAVKANIGHLGAAAGIAGLIKAVLAIHHQKLPPSINFNEPNPRIDFAASPFFVNDRLRPWEANGTPRRAGVSAFGIGGTNAHLVLEEPPAHSSQIASSESSSASASVPAQVVPLSARSAAALEENMQQLVTYLVAHPETALTDIAYTYQIGRKAFSHRATIVCQNAAELQQALTEPASPLRAQRTIESEQRGVVFMFSGLGEHYPQIGRLLYERSALFRAEFDRCAEILKPYLQQDIRTILYPAEASAIGATNVNNGANIGENSGTSSANKLNMRQMLGRESTASAPEAEALNQTRVAQPILFSIEYALAQLWQAHGVHPEALIGHSIGEYVAACLAGIFSLEDALKLVARRAELIYGLPSGAMLAVNLSEDEVTSRIPSGLSLAAINGESLCTVAGPDELIEEFTQQMQDERIACRRLQTTHAFHSTMMAPVADKLIAVARTVRLHEPTIPCISNVTGTWMTSDQALDPAYWGAHLCQTVRFASGIQTLWSASNPLLLEVGPGHSLGTLAMQHSVSRQMNGRVTVPSLRHHYESVDDDTFFRTALGKLWLGGVPVLWDVPGEQVNRRRLSLPTYPFERQRYWAGDALTTQTKHNAFAQMSSAPSTSSSMPLPSSTSRPAALQSPEEWLYTAQWHQQPLQVEAENSLDAYQWLLFLNDDGLSSELVALLTDATHVHTVYPYHNQGAAQGDFALDPTDPDVYLKLIETIDAASPKPLMVVYLWSTARADDENVAGTAPQNVTSTNLTASNHADSNLTWEANLSGLINFVQSLDACGVQKQVHLTLVAHGTEMIAETETIAPQNSALLGSSRVLPQEYPQLSVQAIDIRQPSSASWQVVRTARQILDECLCQTVNLPVAYRGGQRWVKSFTPLAARETSRLRQGGVYLLLDGFQGYNFLLARYLAEHFQARLVLTTMPTSSSQTEESVAERATQSDTEHDDTYIAQQVQILEELGATVHVIPSLMSDGPTISLAVDDARNHFGDLHGLIHTVIMPDDEQMRTVAEWRDMAELNAQCQRLDGLASALRDQQLDFGLLNTSLLSVFGGVGLLDATTLSLYADALVAQENQHSQTPWVSINWDHWRLQAGSGHHGPALALADGIKIFQQVLSTGSAMPVMVSPLEMNARVAEWKMRKTHQRRQIIQQLTGKGTHSRPDLPTAYQAPESEVEEMIVEQWQSLLGVEPVGIHDNFFDLGGHSLMGAQLIARFDDIFDVQLSLRFLFDSPTVAQQALQIEEIIITELENLPDSVV